MIKRTLIMIALICMLVVPTIKAAGPTVSFMTEQITNVDKGNSLLFEVGYFLGAKNGPGLEPYAGTIWWPRWDEEGEMTPPSIIVLGVRNWFDDLVDSNSAVPFIPKAFLTILNEDVDIRPYIGFKFSANVIDKNAGLMSIPIGITVKTSPESPAALRFEMAWNDTFLETGDVPDNRLSYYMGFYYPF